MAFIDFHATGEAPTGNAARIRAMPFPRRAPRRRGSAQRWRPLLAAAVTLPAFAATGLFAARMFDDFLLGALAAVLLYAISAPVAARLLDAGVRQSRPHTKV